MHTCDPYHEGPDGYCGICTTTPAQRLAEQAEAATAHATYLAANPEHVTAVA